MAKFETWLRNDLQQIPEVVVLNGNFFSADLAGNRIGVILTDNGEPVNLTGGTVMGYVIRNDQATLSFPGECDVDHVWIDLAPQCYTVIGPISIVIKLNDVTVCACSGYVYETSTDVIVDPGHIIPSIAELLEKVDELEAATARANASADLADEKAAYADQMAEEASRVDLEMTKNQKVLTFQATNRNNVTVTKTATEPTLKVTKSGITVTLTAEDADGTTQQSFTDAPINDNAGAGDTESLWSADKLTSEFRTKIDLALKGTRNGVAELDATGKVPASQLPSFVDDVLEYAAVSDFPATGEANKIYVATGTNLTYRWTGSGYVEISKSLAIGETSSTAFAGDKGKVAYDHALAKGVATASGLYVITTNGEGHVTEVRTATKADIGLDQVDNTADIDKPSSAATRQSEQNAASSADTARNAQYNAEAWAVGTRNGIAVGSTDETYNNNAKTYSENSEAWAVGSRNGTPVGNADETYDNNAKAYAKDAEAWAVGTRNGMPVDSTDDAYQNNAKVHSEDSEAWAVGTRNGTVVGNTDETYQNNAKSYAEQAVTARNDILGMQVHANTLPENSQATASYSHGLLTLGIPVGQTGATGATGQTGPGANITGQSVAYQNSIDGSVIPAGTWTSNRPETPQGQFLWTKTTISWNVGTTTILYSVSYIGKDGVAQGTERIEELDGRVDDLQDQVESVNDALTVLASVENETFKIQLP